MLDYFLRLLYQKLETSPKRHIAACAMFNTFVDTFRKKLWMLLDDVEQFFLWVVAAMLDKRRTGFDWFNPMWGNKHEWPNVTKPFKSIHHLMSEVEQNIADQVKVDLSLPFSSFSNVDPKYQRCFWGRVQLEHRKTRGYSASSSEQEGDASEHTKVEPLGEEWWKSILRRGATAKPKKSRRGYSLTKECRAMSHKWLTKPQVIPPRSGLVIDLSNWTVLQ